MLRGVNKQIIEINSTDNCYFEKAILFVRPEFAEASEIKLRDKANEFLKDIESEKQLITNFQLKKQKRKLKLNKKIICSIIVTVAIVGVSLGVIFKII